MVQMRKETRNVRDEEIRSMDNLREFLPLPLSFDWLIEPARSSITPYSIETTYLIESAFKIQFMICLVNSVTLLPHEIAPFVWYALAHKLHIQGLFQLSLRSSFLISDSTRTFFFPHQRYRQDKSRRFIYKHAGSIDVCSFH